MPYQKRCGCKIHHTPKRWGKIYIYTRKHLTTRSHSSFFPLLCHLSSSQKDKLFHTTIRANKALFPEDPHRMSSVLPGQHPALLPQLLYDSSSPSLRFLPSRPLALTSGRARGSLRVAASKLCICWLTRQTDKGEAHPVDIPPGRMWMGVSLPCSATILIKKRKKKKVETWCLWELLSVCHSGMKLAKGINVLWALPTGRGEAAAETKLK